MKLYKIVFIAKDGEVFYADLIQEEFISLHKNSVGAMTYELREAIDILTSPMLRAVRFSHIMFEEA